ncbi:GATA zinc finger domain-containing protein 14-like [Argonauta hians]
MEAGLHCCYNNSTHQRYGTLMDSPPPPYYGCSGHGGSSSSSSGSEDSAFESTMFSVLGSGRKYIPCPHCRLKVGAFDTLLLKSDGLRKGKSRSECIFLVSVLERYDIIGNGDSLEGRLPQYNIDNASNFGAEYCRHCNQSNSVCDKPPSCDSTRAETSSPASSDVEQFSTSLEDNSSLTNQYSERSNHQNDDKYTEGNDTFYSSKHTGKHNKYKQRSHNGYCQKKSAKTLDEIAENKRNNANSHVRRSQPKYIPNHKCNSSEYSSPWYSKSHLNAKDNIQFNSNSSCPHNSSVGYQNGSVTDETSELLYDKIDSKFEDVFKESHFNDQSEKDIDSIKASIANFIEVTLRDYVSSYDPKSKLSSTENRISYSKVETPLSMKLDYNENNASTENSLKENIFRPNSSAPNHNNEYSKESREDVLYFTENKATYPPLSKLNENNGHFKQEYQYQNHQDIAKQREDEQTVQTPGNDSGFFSPSPRILSSPIAWQQQKYESDSKSFRYNSNINSDGFQYPKPETYKSDDSDQYEIAPNTRNRKRTKVGNIHQSNSTETRSTSSKVKISDDDLVISPKVYDTPKIKPLKKGKFRRSTDHNESQNYDPKLQCCTQERKFRKKNADVSPTRSMIEEAVIEPQSSSQTNVSPPSGRIASSSPEFQLTEWETDIGEQLSATDNLNTSLSESSEATDISNTDDSYGNIESLRSESNIYKFDIYSKQVKPPVDIGEIDCTKKCQTKTHHPQITEASSSTLQENSTVVVGHKAILESKKTETILKDHLRLDNGFKTKCNEQVEIKGECSVEKTQVQIGLAAKESLPKTPSIDAVKTCKKQDANIGTFIEGEADLLSNSLQNGTLYIGGPFQPDQRFRSWLSDIKCNDEGQFIVCDWSNCCIQMFSTVGLPGDRVTFKSGPWSLALMKANVVACTIPYARQIAFLSHGDRLVVVGLVSTERCYWGIAVTRDQNLVCSCILGIDLLSTTGKPLRTLQYNQVGLDFFIFPQYVTIGENDVIYVSDSCGTYLLGIPKEGAINFEFRPMKSNRFITPRDIEYSPNGYVYIADTETNKIYRLTKDGNLDCELFTAKDGIKGPLGLTLRDNNIIMTQKDSSILVLPL